MTRLTLLLAVAIQTVPRTLPQHAPIDATVTSVKSVSGSLAFFNPALNLKGVIEPAMGNRLQLVEIALGQTPVFAELRTFALVSKLDDEYAPIAVGGRSDLVFPVDKLAVGREMGQVLSTNAMLVVTRQSEISVMLEAGPLATLAFLYELPPTASVKALRLPDGRALSLQPDLRDGAACAWYSAGSIGTSMTAGVLSARASFTAAARSSSVSTCRLHAPSAADAFAKSIGP